MDGWALIGAVMLGLPLLLLGRSGVAAVICSVAPAACAAAHEGTLNSLRPSGLSGIPPALARLTQLAAIPTVAITPFSGAAPSGARRELFAQFPLSRGGAHVVGTSLSGSNLAQLARLPPLEGRYVPLSLLGGTVPMGLDATLTALTSPPLGSGTAPMSAPMVSMSSINLMSGFPQLSTPLAVLSMVMSGIPQHSTPLAVLSMVLSVPPDAPPPLHSARCLPS